MKNLLQLEQIVANQPFPLLFATVSGAHLYGFPSSDSDYDLRGSHIFLPIQEIAGLYSMQETIEVSQMTRGLELDLVTHDLKKFLALLLKRNGTVLFQHLILFLIDLPIVFRFKLVASQPELNIL